MLTSLLPGVRDLRAPLAAGFIFMFALWIGLEPPNKVEDASGIWKDVLELKGTVSVVGLGAAIGFVAYLLGSVSEAILATPVIAILTSKRGTTRVEPPGTVGARVREDLTRLTDRAWQEAITNLANSQDAEEADLRTVVGEPDGLEERVRGEFEDIRTRLLIQQPEVYGKVDRLRSEGELRVAIAPALVGLAIALSFRDEVLLGLGVAMAAVLLVGQGLLRYRSSNDALVEALRLDAVTAPSFDDLFSYTEDQAGQQRLKWAANRVNRGYDADIRTPESQMDEAMRRFTQTEGEEQPVARSPRGAEAAPELAQPAQRQAEGDKAPEDRGAAPT